MSPLTDFRCRAVSRALVGVVALVSCAVKNGELLIPHGEDATPADSSRADGSSGDRAGADASVGSCSPWTAETRLEPPQVVAELNSPESERAPFVTADGLMVYFSSDRPGGAGANDIYVARRSDPDARFDPPRNMSSLNTADDETALTISADGLTAYLATTRPGGVGASDIWIASRSRTDEDFASADFSAPPQLNSPVREFDPFPSHDGRQLYFVSYGVIAVGSNSDILVASRADVGAPWGGPTPVPGVNGAGSSSDGNPSITADGLLMVLSSQKDRSVQADVLYAVRADPAGQFSAPLPAPQVNDAERQAESYISPDGCTLYFTQGQPSDIYRSRVVRSER